MTEDILERAKAAQTALDNGTMWTEDTEYLFEELIAEVERRRGIPNLDVEAILTGIDVTEVADPVGWWETSEGAEFGARKKERILAVVASKDAEIERLRLENASCHEDLCCKSNQIDQLSEQIDEWIADRDSWIARYEAAKKEKDARINELSEKFDKYALAWTEIINSKAVRIKELEAAVVDGRAQYLLTLDQNRGIIAWDFDEISEADQDALRKQATENLKMEEPWALIQLREARERIKELEAHLQS